MPYASVAVTRTLPVEAAVRAAMRGEPHDSVDKAIRSRVRDAFLLFELVLKVNLAPVDAGELEGLGLDLLAYQMRSFEMEAEVEECRDLP